MGTSMDLRKCFNAISDVITNRPKPLREFDQIYMKAADMLLQTDHISKWFNDKDIVFIGDGDAISLCSVYLHSSGLIECGPRSVFVLDFDERIILSIKEFAKKYGVEDRVNGALYNVANPLPKDYWERFNAFYSNPPFGASNEGKSIEAFQTRAIEAVGVDAVGCLVIADYDALDWTRKVLFKTQRMLIESGFVIREMLPEFHRYHLDDTPELTSCSIIVRRLDYTKRNYESKGLDKDMMKNFYGQELALNIAYIRDLTNGGKLPSRDHILEPMKGVY